MGFFKDLRDDISQAVNELLPDDDFFGIEEEETEENDFLHLEEEKEQSILDDVSLEKQTDTLLSKTEAEFNGDEMEKSVNEEVQEDILAALAHLDEGMSIESGLEATEIGDEEEEIVYNEEESSIIHEVSEKQQEEESVMEQPSEDLETEHAEMELPGIEDDEERSSDIIENQITQDIESEEAEIVKDEPVWEEPDILNQELLEEEAVSELTDGELTEEENEMDFLETKGTERLDNMSEMDILGEDILEKEPDMKPEEESNIETVELQSGNESDLEESMNMPESGLGETVDTFSEDDSNDEQEELSLTYVQNSDKMDEESSQEIVKENLEDVSMTENFETLINQQEDEESMFSGKKAEVLEPMIEENIIEKGENIMENNLENVQATDQVTVITKGTVINGSISSDGGLEVNGTITGDVECLGKLTVNGNVSGHLKAAEVVVSTPRLDGGIDSQGDVKIGVGTIVIGDVTAKSATISGAVKGEIDVQGPVVVDSTAIVKGNITAKSVQINNGAVVDGYCKLSYAEVDIDNFFDGE